MKSLRFTMVPALALTLLAACGCNSQKREVPDRPGPQRIIFVTIDTLRADHLASYGYPRQTSRFVDSLAAKGARFERVRAPISTTSPAHASMFTSLYPMQHRVLQGGHVLPDDAVTMAEILQTKGYRTAGFVSTDCHFVSGNIAQGFDHIDEPILTAAERYRPADQTVEQALDWIADRDEDDRFFLWIHLFDAHDPYHPPREHHRTFVDEPQERREAMTRFLTEEHHVDPEYFGSAASMLSTIDLYDAEIRFADEQLERVYHRLEKRGLSDDSVWVVTADHGEGLGNHNWMRHGRNIYNEQVHVPLILYASSGEFAGQVVDKVVETVDIMPTLLNWIDDFEYQSHPGWQGTSMLSLLRSGEGFPDKFAFSQRKYYDHSKVRSGYELENYEPGETYAVQDGQYKLIHRTEGPDELFAIDDDPYETRNLVGTGLEQESALRAHLRDKIEQLQSSDLSDPLPIDEAALERLRSLGYVQ